MHDNDRQINIELNKSGLHFFFGWVFYKNLIMAVLGTALAKELLGFDDANKAFRPWWDTTQDFLMYGMVVLGMNALFLPIIERERTLPNYLFT